MAPDNLHLLPRLGHLIDGLQEIAHKQGIETAFGHEAGMRGPKRQWALFRQGRHRNDKGIWVPIDPVRRTGIVTNATPRKSPHCPHVDSDGSVGSAACDVWIVINKRPALKRSDIGYELYPRLGAIGESLGLTWGGRFSSLYDADHFELSDFRELGVPNA